MTDVITIAEYRALLKQKKRGKKSPSRGEEDFALQMNLAGIPYQREFRFHPTRKWKFDFAFPAHKIAVEIEGGVYIKSRHTSPKGFMGDMQKYNAAAIMGWRVLRYTTDDVKNGKPAIVIAGLIRSEVKNP